MPANLDALQPTCACRCLPDWLVPLLSQATKQATNHHRPCMLSTHPLRRSGETARVHLVACSEQFLEVEPEGYAGGAIDVPALEQRASSRVSLEFAAAGAGGGAGGEAEQQSGEADGAAEAAEAGWGASMGTAVVAVPSSGQQSQPLHRGTSSKRNFLADRTASGLDRTATGLAAAAPGASRWGASYWTQVGAVCFYTQCNATF